MIVVRVFGELRWGVRPVAADDVNGSSAEVIADHADEGREARIDVGFGVAWDVFHHAAETGQGGRIEATAPRDELPFEVLGAAHHAYESGAFGGCGVRFGFGFGRRCRGFGIGLFLRICGFSCSFGPCSTLRGGFFGLGDLAFFGDGQGEAGFDALSGAKAVHITKVFDRDSVTSRDGSECLAFDNDMNDLGRISVYWPNGRDHGAKQGDAAHRGAS